MTLNRRIRLGEQTQGDVVDLTTAETDTDLRLGPDGVGGLQWSTGGGSSSSDCEHEHTHDRFVAAGATPETFTLSRAPLFDEVQVSINGLIADPDDVSLSGSDVSVDTSASDVVVIFYAAECEDDVFKQVLVSVDFSDIPNDTDTKTLYTPAVGETVYVTFNTSTLVPIGGGGVTSGNCYMAFGQNAAQDTYQALLGLDIVTTDVIDAFGGAAGLRQVGGDTPGWAGDYCATTDPIIAFGAYDGNGPITQGHADLILIIRKAS